MHSQYLHNSGSGTVPDPPFDEFVNEVVSDNNRHYVGNDYYFQWYQNGVNVSQLVSDKFDARIQIYKFLLRFDEGTPRECIEKALEWCEDMVASREQEV